MLQLRITFLVNGMTGYLNAEFEALSALGNDLLLVTPGSPEASVGSFLDTAFGELGTEAFARVHTWEVQPEAGELVELVTSFEPDAVLMSSWNFSNAYRAVMKAVPDHVVRILIMDGLWRATSRQWLGRLTHRWYVDPVADAVMVPSDRTEFFARRLGFGPADIIRGSVSADTRLFNSPPRHEEELAACRSFLYVGRLVEHKGADVLAAAYARYRELVSDPWDLNVAGIGPLDSLLRAIPGVTMHGFVQPPRVAELMRTSSCFLLTSHVEPYGAVVHEATACGLPILCSDFSGVAPGFVQDGYNGWMVPSGDVESWAELMQRISSLAGSRLAEMSDVSRSLSIRLSPDGWARNLNEELARRRLAGGGRLS